MLTYVYQLFPNTRLATLSSHYLLVILEPVSPLPVKLTRPTSLWLVSVAPVSRPPQTFRSLNLDSHNVTESPN